MEGLQMPLPRVKARGMPNAPSPLPILRLRSGQAKEGKKWQKHWIPDQVGDDREGQHE